MSAPVAPARIGLVRPGPEWLAGYEDALARGWSPDTTHDISQVQLDRLRSDPATFFQEAFHSAMIRLPDGREVSRLPARDFLITDGDFCGRIGLRFQPGTEDLPPHVLGHVGYAVVPWKQRRGYATQALRMILPVARALGLVRVKITCDDDNAGSIKVIGANGGILSDAIAHGDRPGRRKLVFWVPTEA